MKVIKTTLQKEESYTRILLKKKMKQRIKNKEENTNQILRSMG